MINIKFYPAINFKGCANCVHRTVKYGKHSMEEIDYCQDCIVENEKADRIFPALSKILPHELEVRFIGDGTKFFDKNGNEFLGIKNE